MDGAVRQVRGDQENRSGTEKPDLGAGECENSNGRNKHIPRSKIHKRLQKPMDCGGWVAQVHRERGRGNQED